MFVISGSDLTLLPDAYGVVWPLTVRLLFSEEPPIFTRRGMDKIDGFVLFDGEAFDDEDRAYCALYFLFKWFRERYKRWPEVFKIGKYGGIKRLTFEEVKQRSDEAVSEVENVL